jgi:ubiquinone/menaquinone biosynthesis C-methylase UbiE
MLKTKIMKAWDCIAKEYGGYRRKPWPFLKEFLDKVDDDLLDIGSAHCPNTKVVLKRGIKLYAVDFSKEMLNLAPKEIIKIKSDCTKIPLKRKFKYILAISVLHCLPTKKDQLACLKEIKRLLAKGGSALISTWNIRPKGHIVKYWGDIERDYYILDKSDIINLLNKVGFKNYDISTESAGNFEIPSNYIIKIKK